MLLAPFALTDSSLNPRTMRVPPSPSRAIPAWLVGWAVAGALALICFPSLRGGAFAGATVPFWLLGAPLIDMAWITRARWMALGRRRDH